MNGDVLLAMSHFSGAPSDTFDDPYGMVPRT